MLLQPTLLLLLTTLALSSPLPAKKAATGASVLTSIAGASYNDISISSGTAGNAKSQAAALFSAIDMNNLATVSAADLKTINGVHDVAEDAETGAFNDAVEAADGDAATALQNGKIKNKVLKLTAEVLAIQVKAAQGGDGSKLAEEQTKLAKNIQLDEAASGDASMAVSFAGTV